MTGPDRVVLRDACGEELVFLPDGSCVLFCVWWIIAELQASGHLVTMDDGGSVRVDPRPNTNCEFILESNLHHVRSVIANEHARAAH